MKSHLIWLLSSLSLLDAAPNSKKTFCTLAAREDAATQFVAAQAGCPPPPGQSEVKEIAVLWKRLEKKQYEKIDWSLSTLNRWNKLARAVDWKKDKLSGESLAAELQASLNLGDEIERAFALPALQARAEFQNFVLLNSFCVSESDTEGYQNMVGRMAATPEDFLARVSQLGREMKSPPLPRFNECPLLERIIAEEGLAAALGGTLNNELQESEHPRDQAEAYLRLEKIWLRKDPQLDPFFDALRASAKN